MLFFNCVALMYYVLCCCVIGFNATQFLRDGNFISSGEFVWCMWYMGEGAKARRN